jgi:hypothetical protein
MGTKRYTEACFGTDGARRIDIIELSAGSASRGCPARVQKAQYLQRYPTDGQPAFSLAVPIPISNSPELGVTIYQPNNLPLIRLTGLQIDLMGTLVLSVQPSRMRDAQEHAALQNRRHFG